ncbi:hypothetical protein KSS87_005131 [Heliosperma pusillum]|nr:hypothetical protein KSS87_005131 [Heliosperma pusillum]
MSTTTISEYKKPLHHRRDNSGELDVFEAARYFSGYNDNNALVGDQEKVIKKGKQGNLRPRGASLDMPSFKQNHQYYYKEYHQNYTLARLERHHQNQPQPPPPPHQQQQQQQQRQQIKENKKIFKQPSSPGGKLAQFLNSIFNQTSITSKKKKQPKTTLSMKDEDESPNGRRLRRSSISHFRSTSSVVDEKPYYSSSISGLQTPIIPYTINTPTTKVYQNVKNFQDYKQVLATLSKYKIQEKELAKSIKDAKVKNKGGNLDDYSNNNHGNYEEKKREMKKFNEDKMVDDDDYEVESDASSDLFELQIDDGFTFCSSGGLAEEVNEAILHAAFIPFGEIKDVKTPLDLATNKHRSFGFVTFLERDDAAAAMDNLDGSELYGRVLTVNYALPEKIKGGEQGWAAQPIWADADTWFERQQMEEEMQRLQAENKASNEAAEELHRKKMAEERDGEKDEDPMARAEAEAVQQNHTS